MSQKINMEGWKMWEHGVPESHIIVLKEYPELSIDNRAQWYCKCNLCGKTFIARGKDIRSGNTKSCGCLSRLSNTKKIDMIGKTFNYLTVISEMPERQKAKIMYRCICKCGKECIVEGGALRRGNTKSCGCYKKKSTSERTIKDLTGRKFGKLTVIEITDERAKDGRCQWLCSCDCGNTIIVSSHALLSNNTLSCGYVSSYGELKINQLLNENKINFLYNKGYFQDLKSDNNRLLRYDFIVLNNENKPIRIIEFDGPQHKYSYANWGGEEKLQQIQKLDKIKNEYALSHNIPLVRIPYKERDHITLEMIMGDKYLIKTSNG